MCVCVCVNMHPRAGVSKQKHRHSQPPSFPFHVLISPPPIPPFPPPTPSGAFSCPPEKRRHGWVALTSPLDPRETPTIAPLPTVSQRSQLSVLGLKTHVFCPLADAYQDHGCRGLMGEVLLYPFLYLPYIVLFKTISLMFRYVLTNFSPLCSAISHLQHWTEVTPEFDFS